MICVTCTNINTDGQEYTHHQTCETLKNSVDLGCYICNCLWAALTLDERCAASAMAESGLGISSDATQVSINNESTSSAQIGITTVYSRKGGRYVHLGGCLLSISFNATAVSPQKLVLGTAFWRASILLQPLNGKTKSNECQSNASH